MASDGELKLSVSEAFFEKMRAPGYAANWALDLIMLWCAGGQPLDVSDDQKIVDGLANRYPNRAPTLEQWLLEKPSIKEFFVEVRPNVWAPSPEFFAMNDALSESLRSC